MIADGGGRPFEAVRMEEVGTEAGMRSNEGVLCIPTEVGRVWRLGGWRIDVCMFTVEDRRG